MWRNVIDRQTSSMGLAALLVLSHPCRKCPRGSFGVLFPLMPQRHILCFNAHHNHNKLRMRPLSPSLTLLQIGRTTDLFRVLSLRTNSLISCYQNTFAVSTLSPPTAQIKVMMTTIHIQIFDCL